MGNWECSKRLFPGAEIKATHAVSTTETVSLSSQLSKVDDPGKFLTCAIMEMKPISTSDNKEQNRIYFKSEVAIKGENYGWIMWTLVSTLPTKSSNSNIYSSSLDFVYRLVALEKVGDKWEVKGGVGWDHYSVLGTLDGENMIIAPPMDREGWFTEANPRNHKAKTPFQERVWAGIGEVDDSPTSTNKGLLQSITIYNKGSDYTNVEVWGSNGDFETSNTNNDPRGYDSVSIYYDKVKGWQSKTTRENISSTLKNWYSPFKEKKIRWSNLKDRCDAWSRVRGQTITVIDQDLQSLCYHK